MKLAEGNMANYTMALVVYLDRRSEYELASMQEDSAGNRSTAMKEKKEMEAALEHLQNVAKAIDVGRTLEALFI